MVDLRRETDEDRDWTAVLEVNSSFDEECFIESKAEWWDLPWIFFYVAENG